MTTLYAGAIEYEIDGSTTTLTKHYDTGGQRVAVRNGSSLNYLLNDHLGSTSVILKTNGALWGELRYSAWGETRYSNGTIVTDRQYTGQINDGATGLYYYNARYYDPALHRFIQADTIVPDPSQPQSLNRFSYVRNNPVRYNDPTGHKENPWEAAMGMGAGGGGGGAGLTLVLTGGIIVAGAATGYYAAETFNAILEFTDAFDLTPPPSASEQLPPDTPPLEIPTTTGIPAPVAPPFSGGYTTVAQPRLELPIIMTVERLDPPDIPAGITRNQFGNDVMKWGRNDAEARARMETITAEEMVSQGVTLKMAVEWRDYYMNEVLRTPQNPSVRGRIDLMQYTSELLAQWLAENQE